METSLQEQKRAYLKRAVERLKKERGLSQRAIAIEVGETEQELSGKLSDKSKRGITDEYVDRFAKVFGIPFNATSLGSPAPPEMVAAIERMEKNLTTLMSLNATLIQQNADLTQQVQALLKKRP